MSNHPSHYLIWIAFGLVAGSTLGIIGIVLAGSALIFGYLDGCAATRRKMREAHQNVDAANHQR